MRKAFFVALIALDFGGHVRGSEPIWRRIQTIEKAGGDGQLVTAATAGGEGGRHHHHHTGLVKGGSQRKRRTKRSSRGLEEASTTDEPSLPPVVATDSINGTTVETLAQLGAGPPVQESTGGEGKGSKEKHDSFYNGFVGVTGGIVGAAALVVLAAGAAVIRHQRQQAAGEGGEGGRKKRPAELDSIARREAANASKAEAGQVKSSRLAGERANKKIMVREESQIDSARTPKGGAGGEGGEAKSGRGEFFTLTDIDLATPHNKGNTPRKGKFSTPRL